MNRRLVHAYENGDLGYINVLLSATSFSDFVERWDDIRYLIEANENTVRQRKAAAHQVNVARIALLVEQQRLQNAQSAAEQKRQQLAVLADQRRNLLAVAQSEQSNVAQAVSQLEEISQADEDALEALIQERQREEEERRRAAAEAARRAALLSGQEPPPSTAGGPSSFSWPVTGPITSPFGARVDPVIGGLHVHTGIDIGAPSGTTIGAAADGHVIFAGSYGGYGNAIIIDHGGSVSTLYGHCSQIFVGVGQRRPARPSDRRGRHDRLRDRAPPSLRGTYRRPAPRSDELPALGRPIARGPASARYPVGAPFRPAREGDHCPGRLGRLRGGGGEIEGRLNYLFPRTSAYSKALARTFRNTGALGRVQRTGLRAKEARTPPSRLPSPEKDFRYAVACEISCSRRRSDRSGCGAPGGCLRPSRRRCSDGGRCLGRAGRNVRPALAAA